MFKKFFLLLILHNVNIIATKPRHNSGTGVPNAINYVSSSKAQKSYEKWLFKKYLREIEKAEQAGLARRLQQQAKPKVGLFAKIVKACCCSRRK